MIFEVTEIDNDYHAFAGYVYIKADSIEQAQQWCEDQRWTGYDYFVNRELTEYDTFSVDYDLTKDNTQQKNS